MTQLTVSKAKAEFVTLSDGQIIAAYPQVFHARAPWVVFSNSLATDHSIWSAQVEALAGRWNILRYDTSVGTVHRLNRQRCPVSTGLARMSWNCSTGSV